MTRVFTEGGESVPVTVMEVELNRVAQVKTPEHDGYQAVQVAYGSRKPSRVSRPEAGHLKRAGVEPGRGLKEWRLAGDAAEMPEAGSSLGVDMFEVGQLVDVSATSKGKGFAGTIKRHNFRSQGASHGNSKAHRRPGSIGQAQDAGHVFKGKPMPGHMGARSVTVQNLEVVRVDTERNLLLVRGAVPGPRGADITVRSAVKAKG